MKKIILLLTVVSLLAFGFYLIRERSAKVSPYTLLNDQQQIAGAAKQITEAVKSSYPLQQTSTVNPLDTHPLGKRQKKVLSQRQKDIPLHRKTELTPAEIKQLEKARKLERRKNGYFKSDSPDKYAEFQRMIRTKDGAKVPDYSSNYKLTELYTAQRVSAARKGNARISELSWSERGPANVPGRTRGLLAHPDDPQRVWFAGSVSGGVWKTTDAGGNWVNKTPDLPNLATTVLAMSPANPNIIYAGTGEGFFNVDAVNGDGIFKSTDGGETWKQLKSTAGKIEFRNINRIVVDPKNANVLIACTNAGGLWDDAEELTEGNSWILRSADGGNSWSEVFKLPLRIQQLVASPDSFHVQYATVYGLGVIKSTDAGKTWNLANKGMYPAGRIEMAIAPMNPSRLYASAEGRISSRSGGSDLYISNDAGANWQIVLEAGGRPNIDWLRGQGWYDNTIQVHPYNQNIVYVGGVQLWKMTITEGEGRTPRPVITSVKEVNTQSFLDFINLGGQAFGGKMVLGNAPDSLFVSVEIRFGSGKAQKAHRFTVDGRGAGVPPQEYIYRDYVEVPFEVWDITNNRQLMVSFRDQQEDGKFNLLEEGVMPDSTPIQRREYIFIHADTYAPVTNDSIAKNGGFQHKNLYLLWPILREGATWDPDKLPESKLVINSQYLTTRLRITQNISDSYNEYGGKNTYVHPDHHNLVFIRTDSTAKTFKILNANDGGVYVSKPGTDPGFAQGTWIFAGNGYNTTQFYGVDKKREADEYIGGTQDNGTWRSPGLQQASASSSYLFQITGDGFEVSWNYYNPNKIIGSSQFNNFARSLNGGITWSAASNGLTDAGGLSPFITQLATHRSNPDVLYTTGASGVWISDNFGANWKLTPIQDLWAYNGRFSDVKVSEANNQIVWAGHAISSTGRIHVSTDGGQTFTPTSLYPDATLGMITGLATHPTEDSTAFALFSFANTPKILRTKNLGQTWEDISGFSKNNKESSNGFPDVAVYTLLVMPNNPDNIWAGTEIGLVESTDGGDSWSLAQNGLPAVSIWDLKVVDNQVVVATHGRGIWSVTIPELSQPVVFVPYINDLRVATNGKLTIDASLRSPYDSTIVYINDQRQAKIGNTTVKDTTVQYTYMQEGPTMVQLKSFTAGKEYVSTAKTIDFFIVKPAYTYVNSFNSPTNDFFGTGFSIQQIPGFEDGAIHSLHPYTTNNDFTYQLKVPIIIADTNATFKYQDVVIVEPGEPGAPFGSEGFYDYAIVEGTKDGVNWRRLENGYNSDYKAEWRLAYDKGLPGHDSLFVQHTVNMQKVFAPGDTVFFRFRLHSDPVGTAWGWAIDDLAIQEGYKAVGSFTLVNADNNSDIRPIVDKDTINIVRVGQQLNIRANTLPDSVGSVVFELNGEVQDIDNEFPYALAGDNNGYYNAWTPPLGTHTLTATPYTEADGKGEAGKPLTVTFTVIKVHEVVHLVLVNAETGRDIDTLQNGDVIDLQQVGRKLNIRASTMPAVVGSVAFSHNTVNRTENFYPYALAGYKYLRLQYNSWTPTLGEHTLRATPYSNFHAQGTAGIAHQVRFTVVDNSTADILPQEPITEKVVAYPNPGSGKFTLDLKAEEELDITIEVYDFRGNQVLQQKAALFTGNSNIPIDLSALPDGMYFVKALSDRQLFEPLHIIKRQ